MKTGAPRDIGLDEKYWRELKDKSEIAGITLDESISPDDFVTYGDRLAERYLSMFEQVGGPPFASSNILDVGCGVGRLLRLLSVKFSKAVGVDLNDRILDAARKFISEKENVELLKNDGKSLPFPDNSFCYVYCGGVLNYSIMVWMTSRQGGVQGDRVGAKVVSADIDRIINDSGHELAAIFSDPKDPMPHYQILLRKAPPLIAAARRFKRRFAPFRITPEHVTPMSVRTGVFEDLPSYGQLRKRWASGGQRPITFFTAPE